MGSKPPGVWPIPAGTRDLLPGEAKRRRLLENTLAGIFEQWGYSEVATPTLEYYETVAVEMGEELNNQLYRLFDRDGSLLVLRPDMTTPIARLVTSRMRHLELPQRLFYIANVFRYESPQAGRLREFGQAGVELVGAGEAAADAEMIAVAVHALRCSGLASFQLSLGNIAVFNAIMEEVGLPPALLRAVHRALAAKDLVGLSKLLERHDMNRAQQEIVLEVSDLRGGDDVIERVKNLVQSPEAFQAVLQLEEVWGQLQRLQVRQEVQLDLGLIRDFEYYTGIVFEGYTADLGFTICGGGRYDHLLAKFGRPAPATGFALGLDRLLLALANQEERR